MTTPIAFEDKRHYPIQEPPTSSGNHEYVVLSARGSPRSLELHSGSGFLVCRLECERVEGVAMGFAGFSYVWGCDTLRSTVDVECIGRVLALGSNLLAVHLRYQSAPRLL